MSAASKVIAYPEPDYFGDCPQCGRNDGCRSDTDGAQWFICRRHRVKWCIGRNIFSAWRDFTPEQAWTQAAEIATLRTVEPLLRPLHASPAESISCVDELPFE